MLINHKVVETSNNNGSYQVSKYAAGTDLEYRKIIDEAYLSALEVAGKIADETSRKEVEGKIKREYKDRVEFYEKLKTNKDTVKVEVTATAHGSPLDRKRGWEGVNVYLLVQCVAPLDLLDQVKDKYNLKTPELRNINSIKFQGSEVRETTKYFAWRGVDRFTDCNSTQGPISIVKIPFNTLGEVFVDQSMEICYSVLPTPSSVPKFSKDCRAKFGDSMALDNTPSSCVVN